MNILVATDIQDFSVTLIDDVMDNEEKRANKPAHHLEWGVNCSLAVAMFLKSLSSQIIIESQLNGSLKLKILQKMENLHSKIYEGQFLDVEYEKKKLTEISKDDYLKMISLTTGSQFAGFFRIGGIIGGADFSELTLLGEIGLRLGTLGQIRDDLIDYLPEEENIWKTPLLDFKTNKRRLPLIISWANANSQERRKIVELQKKKQFDSEDYNMILKIIMKPRNLEEIKKIMQMLKNEGLQMIQEAEFISEGKNLLRIYFSYGMGEI